MKINAFRIIVIILLIVTFRIIFGFSSQDGEKSGTISKQITEFVTKDIKSIQSLEKNEKEIVLKKIEHVIRKLAHFSLYTVVGILVMSLMKTYKMENLGRISISLLVGVLYAISDEVHQSFVPGRGPSAQDILIDTLGIVFGLLIVTGFIKFYKFLKGKKIVNKNAEKC